MMGLIHTIKGFEVAASYAALSGELNDVLLALNLARWCILTVTLKNSRVR
ncbi:hypothetical protein ACVXG7_17570 [Enterobacter hormaechei]